MKRGRGDGRDRLVVTLLFEILTKKGSTTDDETGECKRYSLFDHFLLKRRSCDILMSSFLSRIFGLTKMQVLKTTRVGRSPI